MTIAQQKIKPREESSIAINEIRKSWKHLPKLNAKFVICNDLQDVSPRLLQEEKPVSVSPTESYKKTYGMYASNNISKNIRAMYSKSNTRIIKRETPLVKSPSVQSISLFDRDLSNGKKNSRSYVNSVRAYMGSNYVN